MNSSNDGCYEFGPFFLDGKEHQLLRDGQAINLTRKAFETLLLLVSNSGHVLTKEEMLQKLWPDTFVEEANLTNNISILRRALGDDSESQQFIQTVPRLGYRFVARVNRVANDPTNEAEMINSKSSAVTTSHRFTNLRSLARRRGISIGLALIALVSLVLGAIVAGRKVVQPPTENQFAPIRSIAVLPLRNLSGDPAQEYFADGMTEAVITELAKIEQLRVISRQSIMQYKTARKTTPEIARELNVDALVQGSVLRENDRVRITAQLIRARIDEHLWSESYEREVRHVLALQGELARGIASEIKIQLTPQEQARLTNTRAINPAAYDAYLNGLFFFNQAINATTGVEQKEKLHKQSFEYFERAIKIEPNYALAYANLARSYHWLASMGFPQFYPRAKAAALKALAIDDTVAEAHGALAFTIWSHEWDWNGAERELKRTIELNPGLGNVGRHGYALLLSALGRHDEAIREMKIAQDLDPLTLPLRDNLGVIYLYARQYDQAIAQSQSILELNSQYAEARLTLGEAYIHKGMHKEGLAEFQKAIELSNGWALPKKLLAWGYAKAGRRREALKIVNELKTMDRQRRGLVHVAAVYAELGERDEALALLESAYQYRGQGLLSIKVMPAFDGLREHPRFQDLMRRVGFP